MVARLLLVRHAQSEWNADGRWQGWADPALSESGAAACAAARDDPILDHVQAAAASDLSRAWRSAEILAEGRPWAPVVTVRGLRERGAGEWTGLTRDEIQARWPGALRAQFADIPGGEDAASVTARGVAALHRIAERFEGMTVLVVSHGALIRLITHHLGATPEHVPNLGGLWVEVSDARLRAGEKVGPLGAELIQEAEAIQSAG